MSRFLPSVRARIHGLPSPMGLLFILALLPSCEGGKEPIESTGEASIGACPVTIDIPSTNEVTGSSIQISVTQNCSRWTDSMIAYIDGQRCDEAPYPFPNSGCATFKAAQNFSASTWVRVMPGKHTLNVNNWSSDGTVGVSTPIPFTYRFASADAGPDARTDSASDAAPDALPPGTINIPHLDEHMFQIANGGADHCTTASSHDYCGGSCNGSCAGSTARSSYSVESKILEPAMDASSTRVEVSGPATDTLEWVKLDPAPKGSGPYQHDTHFVWDFYFYPTTTTDVQAYEFDAFYGANGWWLMMGTQCDLASGNWNGWDEATGHWVSSSVNECGSFFHVNEWNHIILRFHRDPGIVGSSTRYYYDGLEVNGVNHTWGLGGFTGRHNGWDDVIGAQVQQDLKSSFAGTLTTYYDAFTFQISP
jgi:hypothetical protein